MTLPPGIAEGDVIRTPSDPQVFLIEAESKRYFPDEPTFFSRYGTYDVVKVVPEEVADAIARGPDIPSVQSQTYTPPTGPVGRALTAALVGPEKKKLKVFNHEFNVKPIERVSPAKAVGHISHHLSFRPDDQVYYAIEKQNGVIGKIDIEINRGGWAPIAAPIISALGQYYGGVAIPPDQVEDVGRKLGAILDGSWERAAQALIGYIAADPRL